MPRTTFELEKNRPSGDVNPRPLGDAMDVSDAKKLRNILVVDDEPQIRDILRRKLEKSGYGVWEAANGQEAIDELRAGKFDLVLADILMPEKDGLEVIMFIQREQPSVKCVAISAPSNKVFLQSAQLLGATRIIEKPFEIQEVENVVRELIG